MNYTDPKYYHLEPYHNPDEVDESKVPKGWRMRYQSEAGELTKGQCIAFLNDYNKFSFSTDFQGTATGITYIVPVNEA